jgi:hypothetical protein
MPQFHLTFCFAQCRCVARRGTKFLRFHS